MEEFTITKFNSDSGNRDLGAEKKLTNDIPFIEILNLAVKLKAKLIVKTSYVNEQKPGAWYIKGYRSNLTNEKISLKINENIKNNKYNKRTCFLINYF